MATAMLNVEATEPATQAVGKLTLLGNVCKDLVRARCACGAVVLLASADWGSQYGCPQHHSDEVDRIETMRREAAEKAEHAQRQADWKEKMLELNVNQHYEDLSPSYKKLVRLLCQYALFDVRAVENLCKVDHRAAWDIILQIMGANCLLEYGTGASYGEFRKYSLKENYSMQAREWAQWKVRNDVRKLIEAEDAPAPQPTAEAIEPPPTPENELGSFLDSMCVKDLAASVSSIVLRDAYWHWAQDRLADPVDVDTYKETLASLGYPESRAGYVQGLRLKLKREMQPEAA